MGTDLDSSKSIIVYEEDGECMKETINKLWKEFESSLDGDNKKGINFNKCPTLEIKIPAKYISGPFRQSGQLWGSDIYTDDSDLVAAIIHVGYCHPTTSTPSPSIQELRATIRVLPPQERYLSSMRNNIRSSPWGATDGCSYRIERCCVVKILSPSTGCNLPYGGLQFSFTHPPHSRERVGVEERIVLALHRKHGSGIVDLEPSFRHTSIIESTVTPVAVERKMTTRSAASNASRQPRFLQEVIIQYNLCNEPWIKYSLWVVADQGLKQPLYTSARLKKGEVLYLETQVKRYELCFTGERMMKGGTMSEMHDNNIEKSQNNHLASANKERTKDCDKITVDGFRWSLCKNPLPEEVMRSVGIPLPLDKIEVLVENLDWEDVKWSGTGVWVGGKEYTLARVHFLSRLAANSTISGKRLPIAPGDATFLQGAQPL